MIIKQGFSILFLILFIWNTGFAQERVIEGKITDEEGNPISGVLVSVKGKDVSVYSDKNGYFILKLSPETITTLLFSHPEMQSTTASVGLNNRIDVTMHKKSDQDIFELSLEDLLNAEVTTASKTNEKQSDAPGIISVITKEELDRFGGTTLSDILERIPGMISSTTVYSNRSTMVVRGDYIKQNSGHILFLINGRPVREIQEGGVSSEILETFPVNAIEKIEVIKGPGSVLYGSDAFSGVINIITTGFDNRKASITGMYQNGGGYKTYGDVTTSIGDLNISAAGQFHQKTVWETPYTRFISTDDLRDSTYYLNIPDYGPGLFLNINYKNFTVNSSINEWNSLNMLPLKGVSNTKLFTNFGYSTSINDTWHMDLNLTYTRSKLYGVDFSKRNSRNIIAEWTNHITISEKSKLAIGGLFNSNNGTEYILIDPENSLVISEGNRNGVAMYAQIDFLILENLKLIGGLQMNKEGDIEINLVPRSGVIWYPFEKFSIKALYSEAYKAPSINELYVNFPGFSGNEDLKPEKVSTFDLGFNYQGKQSQFSVSLFKSMLTDIIQPVFIDNTSDRIYSNLQSIDFIGGELEGKYYVNKSVFLTGSVSYQTNESNEEKNVTPIASFGCKAGISIKSNNGILVSLFDIYQGDPDDRFVGDKNPGQGSFNLLHLNSRFTLNQIFNFEAGTRIDFLFNVDNLLDKVVFKNDWGGFGTDGIPTIPGREMYAGLQFTF